ncbi:arsenosugar biosynthesis radical SAM (seleno)protein ArsS [Roseivirga sp. BDSF3-8]|uniref:arsenosugar biosynthesis radical SAM (seleno)protein ArsS n=1 Tax=Roseivirga sp. BDSF3-8 TaxID=3241598 RepID=UPI0035323F69
MKSLKAQGHLYADTAAQIEKLNEGSFTKFTRKLEESGLENMRPTGIDIMQINVGKMCNQTCKHCHVDAGPDREEIMTRKTMELCLDILKKYDIPTVDLTGGAPEMNPHFRWFVEEVSKLGKQVIDRCNLTIIRANPKYHDLPDFFAEHGVEVVSSLPHYTALRTDRQRGDGVFGRSIEALQMLNEKGYGMEGSGLTLNLVYNPTGAILPGPQETLENEFKKQLRRKFGLEFNNLFVITNLPISRFLDYLIVSGNYEDYMQKLVDAFNPAAARGVMCRNTISIGWDGYIYDCDFNQMLELKVRQGGRHLSEFDFEKMVNRPIAMDQHCYGCTAGAGSSCGGQTT